MLTIPRVFRALSVAAVLAALLPATSQAQRPALTKNVDERGSVPYMSSAFNYCASSGVCGIYTFKAVPAGFRLVITHVSCSYTSDTGIGHLDNVAYVSDSTNSASVILPVSSVPGGTYMVSSTPVTYYVEPGAQPVVVVGNTLAKNYPQATVVGYLVAIN